MKLFVEPIFRRPSRIAQMAAASCATPPPEEAPRLQPALESFDDRISRLRETFDLLEIDVVRLIGEVMHGGDDAHNNITDLAKATRDISSGSTELAASAENAARYVQRLADASTELKASGEEINRRLRDVNALALDGRRATDDARASVGGLKTSSSEIGSIVGLINSIARKIDLVALNSMIEAARAGEAGKAFTVVAGEVKQLASATQKATEDIARRVEQLQNNSNRLIASVERIGNLIESLSPVILAITAEVETQTGMTADLSRSTDEAAAFANDVGANAKATAAVCTKTVVTAISAGNSIRRVLLDAEKLRSRFVIFLRQTEMGSRREHDRLPCDLSLTFSDGDQLFTGRAVDLSEGGMLAKPDVEMEIATGTQVKVTVESLGRCGALIVGRSMIGLHLKWLDPPETFRQALQVKLAEIRAEHADLLTAVVESANRIGDEMEAAVNSGRVTMEGLFDTDYQLIEGTSPPQYRTPALPVLEDILGPIQNRVLNSNPRIVFCVAVDRNAWLPVHNPQWSLPQRPGEYDWNFGHSRNMRIFDDRAGLAAARNIRPSLIQIYNRDLGGGVFELMKEVNAPIRVFGRHWGGLRVAYRRDPKP
jgi:methyl-accepting chemotaxis protein